MFFLSATNSMLSYDPDFVSQTQLDIHHVRKTKLLTKLISKDTCVSVSACWVCLVALLLADRIIIYMVVDLHSSDPTRKDGQ